MDAAQGARTQSGQAWLDGLQSLRLIPKARKRMCVRVGDEGTGPEQSLKPQTRRKQRLRQGLSLDAPLNSPGRATPSARPAALTSRTREALSRSLDSSSAVQ